MEKHTPKQRPYQTIEDIAAELDILTAQVDAHRFVLGWLLKQLPNDAGRSFLSMQASIFDTDNKDRHAALVVEELDALRRFVAVVLDGDEQHHQDPQ